MNEIDYQTLNERREKAIKDIENNLVETWLHRSSRLFKAVSIQPVGLPSIANANFDGVHYKFISKFHKEYHQQLNNLNKSNT